MKPLTEPSSLGSISITRPLDTEQIMKRLIALALLLGVVLSGCNTMQGAGKDIEHGGQDLQGAAQRNK